MELMISRHLNSSFDRFSLPALLHHLRFLDAAEKVSILLRLRVRSTRRYRNFPHLKECKYRCRNEDIELNKLKKDPVMSYPGGEGRTVMRVTKPEL